MILRWVRALFDARGRETPAETGLAVLTMLILIFICAFGGVGLLLYAFFEVWPKVTR